jgi:hypothetical protein
LSTLIPGYEPSRLLQLGIAEAGLQTTDLNARVSADVSQTDWKRWGLWLVLLLGVALLGLMAASLLRRPSA